MSEDQNTESVVLGVILRARVRGSPLSTTQLSHLATRPHRFPPHVECLPPIRTLAVETYTPRLFLMVNRELCLRGHPAGLSNQCGLCHGSLDARTVALPAPPTWN